MLDPASRGMTSGQRGWPEVPESRNDVAGLRRRRGGEKNGLTCGAYMLVTREREVGVAGRHKPMEKPHSRKGTMGHAGLQGRRGRRWPGKGSGPARQPGLTGPKTKESLKSDLIFKFQWIFGIWQDFEKF
jgi:hypothetical protein